MKRHGPKKTLHYTFSPSPQQQQQHHAPVTVATTVSPVALTYQQQQPLHQPYVSTRARLQQQRQMARYIQPPQAEATAVAPTQYATPPPPPAKVNSIQETVATAFEIDCPPHQTPAAPPSLPAVDHSTTSTPPELATLANNKGNVKLVQPGESFVFVGGDKPATPEQSSPFPPAGSLTFSMKSDMGEVKFEVSITLKDGRPGVVKSFPISAFLDSLDPQQQQQQQQQPSNQQ